MGLPVPTVFLYFVFYVTITAPSQRLSAIYFPTHAEGGGFPFLQSPPTLIVRRLFADGHSEWCEVIPRCELDFLFFK